ncbi:PadR family transcriptional regulator [Methylosinus sp. H3A]|uniref:PadR family transcriptional regulator n=1 Tax=Methylosinus sp. H3A TaxID=2785786 RepID=UPI0018C23019|nr:PadR family transcriptional regulator [Methylosinus sp. H3A]MBG0808933.1 PadR family transcriptional regulator [Methylosinus sp. H3A]
MNHRHRHWGPGEHPAFEQMRGMRGGNDESFGDRGRGRRGFGHGGFGHGGFGPGEGERGGRGRRRMFEGGELRLVILLLLESEPRHGYDIIREIETRTGGAYAPSPGIVYPTLTLLEELGQVAVQATEGAKKLYAITSAGSAHLTENRKEAEAALARFEALRSKSASVDAGPVFRAMGNLKTVLAQRLGGEADKELLFQVADLIDEAARKIERL